MAGWIVLAAFVTLILLRASAAPEARIASGAASMGFGIWMIVEATRPHVLAIHYVPDVFLLVFGLALVVRGALRFATY